MAIYEILCEVKDARKDGDQCDFNGYLEDFLGALEENHPDYELLHAILETDNDLRVIHNYRVPISNTSISNNIIRYKDIKKVGDYPIVIKYVLYTNNSEGSKAVILDNGFIFAKAMYYVWSEKPSEIHDFRRDVVICSLTDSIEDIVRVFASLHTTRTVQLQRTIEQAQYQDFKQAYEQVLQLSDTLEKDVLEKIATNKKNRGSIIAEAVARWFLLKKFVYVQYMIDRQILTEVHHDDVKEQRNEAKRHADRIRFIPYCELWKMDGTIENKEGN